MQPLFISGQAGNLFAVFYPPAQPSEKAILHIPAFAEEMNKSRRMVALQARALAAQGYAVLVLDLYGTGESTGEFGQATWDIWLQDIDSAFSWLREQGAKSIDLWGLRLGVLLGCDFIHRHPQTISRLLCWQPVLNGDTFITQFLRLRIAAAMMNLGAPQEKTADLKNQLLSGQALEVAGYLLNPELIKPLLSLRINELNLTGLQAVQVFEVVAGSDSSPALPTVKFVESMNDKNQPATLTTVVGAPFWATQEIAEVPELITATSTSAN